MVAGNAEETEDVEAEEEEDAEIKEAEPDALTSGKILPNHFSFVCRID